MFYGRKDVCESCGSAVRTLWSVFLLIPFIPRGSFRVIESDEEVANGTSTTRFAAARVPLQWSQVLTTWAVALLAIVFLGWLVVNGKR